MRVEKLSCLPRSSVRAEVSRAPEPAGNPWIDSTDARQGDNSLNMAISFPEHAILWKEHKALG